MAKQKPGPPQIFVDEDGYESDGMFRWGGPKSVSADILHKWLDDFNVDLTITAAERIRNYRSMLTRAMEPFVEGPLSPGATTGGRTAIFLNLSTGAGCYAIDSAVPIHGWLRDVTDALIELAALEKLIVSDSSKIDQIVRLAFRIGVMIARAELRANFGPSVITAKKRRKASAKGGKATAKWTPEIDKLAREIFANERRGKASKDAAYRRTSARLRAEHGVSVSRSTLQRRLSQPNA